MKKITLGAASKFLFIFGFICMQLNMWAQDSSSTSTSTTSTVTVDKTKDFLSQPWVWIVGGVLLLLILIGLFSGKSNKHTQVTKTTVIKEEKSI